MATQVVAVGSPQRMSVLRDFWRRYRRNRLGLAGLGIVLGLGFVALFAPVLAPYEPTGTSLDGLKPPGASGHPLGTDDLGRDILSGILHGARVSLS